MSCLLSANLQESRQPRQFSYVFTYFNVYRACNYNLKLNLYLLTGVIWSSLGSVSLIRPHIDITACFKFMCTPVDSECTLATTSFSEQVVLAWKDACNKAKGGCLRRRRGGGRLLSRAVMVFDALLRILRTLIVVFLRIYHMYRKKVQTPVPALQLYGEGLNVFIRMVVNWHVLELLLG